MAHKFKTGDYVYYYKKVTGMPKQFDTIPCEVIKVNLKTLVLNDGFDTYRNVSPHNVALQSEHPTHINA